jgi:non-specific serine/threonine protein kinase
MAGLLERLDDKFRLLVSPGRGTAARQQSLEAAVDWSYQLLTGAEQSAFRQLSVFPGSFTLDAAEAVAGTDAGLLVLRLVECSLLLPPRPGPDGRSRYSMLETLRSYAARRLGQAAEAHQAASALAAYALRVAGDAATQMAVRDLEQPAALWLDAEDAAVHQALAWALEHDPPAALRLAVALAPWWMLRGRWVQGYAALASAAAQAVPGEGQWCTAQVWLGRLALSPGDQASLTHCSMAVDALRGKPPSADLVDGLTGQSASLRNMGRLAEAEAAASSALDLARQIGHAAGEADALKELAGICMYADDGERAAGWAVQAQRIDQGSTPGWRIREIERILVWVLTASGRPDQMESTRELCTRSLEHARAAGDVGAQADLLFLMEVLALKTGQLTEARTYLSQTAELATRAGNTLRLIDLLDEGGFLCAAAGQYAQAVTLWSAMAAHTAANSLADTAEGERRRRKPLNEAQRALGSTEVTAAEARGAAMTLAAAVEFAVMTTTGETPAPAASAASRLSARERELVALVARGQTDVEIARKLSISASTVRTHLERIRDKTGYRRRADLTRLALSEGLA